MPDEIFSAGDIRGYDFAFDAAGKIIDWTPVIERAKEKGVRLTLSLATLFTEQGDIRRRARVPVGIPKGADEKTVKGRVYSAMRDYVREVSRRELRARLSDEGYDDDEIDDMVADEGDDVSEPNTVALIAGASI